MKQDKKVLLPLLLAATLIIGVYLGIILSANADRRQINFITPNNRTIGGKLNQILNYIEDQYVDTIEKDKLAERAINSLLSDLDPHSYYISADELSGYTEPLEGNFDGIGVEFLIERDTIVVVNTIVGGPSESVGVKAGDRIIAINGKKVAGINIENKDVMKYLRGPSGSKVNIKIQRNKEEALSFTITRGKIPINSVDAALLLNDSTGYIKISRFAKYTYDEFMEASAQLQQSRPQIKKWVIDLRSNGGGYLNSAIQMAEEFLPKGKLIVYTQGKSQPTRKYFSTRTGKFVGFQLDVLVNESSASASEIFAGAMQDNDRATIIGRRTFGKGLVQEQMELPDKSAVRLTVARYYTPTGRSIQKPYGQGIDYESDYEERMQSGELFTSDSIKTADSLKYRTPGGKIVYGGGGIIPDVFVPLDSTEQSLLLGSLLYTGTLNQTAFEYVDTHRKSLAKFKSAVQFAKTFMVDDRMYRQAIASLMGDERQMFRSVPRKEVEAIKLRLKALIARNLYGTEGYYAVMLPYDEMLRGRR